jgi:hypothetical protein
MDPISIGIVDSNASLAPSRDEMACVCNRVHRHKVHCVIANPAFTFTQFFQKICLGFTSIRYSLTDYAARTAAVGM